MHKGNERQFEVERYASSQNLPYDFHSIMHFRHNQYAYRSEQSTIIPKNDALSKDILGSSDSPTALDFLHINLVYCGGKVLNACNLITSCSKIIG